MTNRERTANCVMLLIFVVAFAMASTFPSLAATYPMIMSAAGAVLTAGLIITSEMKDRKFKQNDKEGHTKVLENAQNSKLDKTQIRAIAITLVATLLYVIFIPILGYLSSTFIFMIGLMTLLKNERVWIYICVATGFVAILYVVFIRVLMIWLPSGILI